MKKKTDRHGSPALLRGGSFLFCCCLLLGLPLAKARTLAPDWLSTLAAAPASFAYGQSFSAVLLDEDEIEVASDGTFTHRVRVARRILKPEGKERAVATISYNTNSNRIKSFQGWLLRQKGEPVAYGKKNIVDLAAFESARELYGEGRRQVIDASSEAEAGDVFAYEAVYEERSINSQITWFFSENVPVEVSRIVLHLADGWSASAHPFNNDAIATLGSGQNLSWELKQLAPLRREFSAPDPIIHRPWLAIDVHAPTNGKPVCRQPLFTWDAISTYLTPKYNEASSPDAQIKAKAQVLTDGSANLKTRLQQLCLYAQKVTYISIDLNAAEGGGMIPQPATKVLRCNYGDCKDKATFLRSLLRTQGIDAYPVVLFANNPFQVRADWPSICQFNHVILAIKVDEAIDGPAILVHPQFGRLMLFDPTDPYVPFGNLPKHDCGGLALVLAGAEGRLIRLPTSTANKYDDKITIRLNANGSIEGSIERHAGGVAAEGLRVDLQRLSTVDFNKQIVRWLASSLPTPQASSIEPLDDFDLDAFTLKVGFSANAYGKSMRDTLLVFKPVLFPRDALLSFRRIRRTQSVIINAHEISENSAITLPPGFAVDELPPPVELKSTYGSYKAGLHPSENNQLILERSLSLPDLVVPAKEYEAMRSFYDKIIQAEQSTVVLKRSSTAP